MKDKSLEALSIVNALMLAMFIRASLNKTLMYRFSGTISMSVFGYQCGFFVYCTVWSQLVSKHCD